MFSKLYKDYIALLLEVKQKLKTDGSPYLYLTIKDCRFV